MPKPGLSSSSSTTSSALPRSSKLLAARDFEIIEISSSEVQDDDDSSGGGQGALGAGESDAEDAGEVRGFSDYLQELLPLVPEQNRAGMEDALTDEQLAQRIEDVYENQVDPDNRELYPIQELSLIHI